MVDTKEKTNSNNKPAGFLEWLTEDDSPEIGIATKEPIQEYFSGIKSEFGKIQWPNKEQMGNELTTVLVIVAIISALVYVIDLGLDKFIKIFN